MAKTRKRKAVTSPVKLNFLSQLEQLRELLQGSTTFTENDLSVCLRQCGSNVNRAAELLITGQFQPGTSRLGSSPSMKNHFGPKKSKNVVTPSTSTGTAPSSTASSSVTNVRTNPKSPNRKASTKQGYKSPKRATNTNAPITQQPPQLPYLLCQRWIVPHATTRGSTHYEEPFTLSNSTTCNKFRRTQTHICTVRGREIQGRLDPVLSQMIGPLFNQKLVSVKLKSLTGEQVQMGSDLPMEIHVFIDARPFFSLLEEDRREAAAGTARLGLEGDVNVVQQQQQMLESKARRRLAHAAFGLLQWAQYGDVSVMEELEANLDSIKTEESDESTKISNHKEEEQEEPNVDETFQEEGKAKEWTQSMYRSNENLPEATQPHMFTEHSVTLRSYQRQALHWMMERERHANTKTSHEFQRQLELLAELAREGEEGKKQSNKRSSIFEPTSAGCEVECDCGPVVVSEKTALQSTTLDGVVDPVIHPLWQRRFVWKRQEHESTSRTGKMESNNITKPYVYSFYVNELLKTASKDAPDPPKECVGGILADAMGLGKTVMLLALIGKDKEEREGNLMEGQRKISAPVAIDTTPMANRRFGDVPNSQSTILTSDSPDDMKSTSISDEVSEQTVSISRFKERTTNTLIVAPLSLLRQWEEEISNKTSLTSFTFYGDTVKKGPSSQLSREDIVLTTYGTLQSEYNRFKSEKQQESQKKMLLNHKWHRVILDEAHFIKNPQTGVSKACCALNSERRWCVTGTPIQNSLQDVYGLLKFLKHEPWCEAAFWKTAITKAASQKGDQSRGNESDDADVEVQEDGMKVAVERVRRVLNPLTLRRTKDTLTSEGEPILKLPPIDSSVVHVSLSEPERKFYKALLDKSVSQFEEFIVAGIESKSWLQIFSLLQRLRQACDHLALTVNPRISQDVLESSCTTIQTEFESKSGQANDTDEASAKDNFLDELLHTFNSNESNEIEDESGDKKSLTYSENMAHSLTQTINSNSLNLNDDCPICLDKPPKDDFAITPCAHVFCRKCIIETLNNTNVIKKDPESKIVRVGAVCSDGECPVCLTAVNASKIMFKSKVLKYPQDEKKCKENELKTILKKAMEGQRSSKILKMLNEMDIIWQKKPGSKIIIFSQFLGFLDLMEGTLRQEGIQYFRLDGSMSLKDRHNTITKFSTASKQHGGDSQGSILLASMRACGVGLNLVAASSVFIADPWWNAAIEDQCINRIHRIGQVAKEIFVRKFVVKDSVEEKIVNLQHRKKGMASEILSDKMAAVEMGSNQKSNPTMDDFRLMFRR